MLAENQVVIHNGEVVQVQGHNFPPGSKNEGYLAWAFDYYDWPFRFQVPLFGGRVQGGMVLDFLLFTVPLPTPVPLNGRAHHTQKNREEDDFRMTTLVTRMAGKYKKPVIIWDDQVPTFKAAQALVLEKFGRP
jgi:hypothetical protein